MGLVFRVAGEVPVRVTVTDPVVLSPLVGKFPVVLGLAGPLVGVMDSVVAVAAPLVKVAEEVLLVLGPSVYELLALV